MVELGLVRWGMVLDMSRLIYWCSRLQQDAGHSFVFKWRFFLTAKLLSSNSSFSLLAISLSYFSLLLSISGFTESSYIMKTQSKILHHPGPFKTINLQSPPKVRKLFPKGVPQRLDILLRQIEKEKLLTLSKLLQLMPIWCPLQFRLHPAQWRLQVESKFLKKFEVV